MYNHRPYLAFAVLIALALIIMSLSSCCPKIIPQSISTTVTHDTVVKIVKRDTTIIIPGKEVQINAGVNCDSLHRAQMKKKVIKKNGLTETVEIKDGQLISTCREDSLLLLLELRDKHINILKSVTTKEVDVKEVWKMHWWETALFWIGVLYLIIAILTIARKIWLPTLIVLMAFGVNAQTISKMETVQNTIKIRKTAFEINFDTVRKVPIYNYYEFTAKNRSNKGATRSPGFTQEPAIPKKYQAKNSDYKRPFDKGHYVPNNDMRYNQTVQDENMTYANVAPQWASMNEVQWRLIENYVRDLGSKYDTLQINTGGIYSDSAISIGPDHIYVPDYYFKTVLIKDHGTLKGIAFLTKNCPQLSHDPMSYVVSIDKVEELLKMDLYSEYPASVQALFEK